MGGEMDDSRFEALLRAAAGLDSGAGDASPLMEGECLSFFRWEEHLTKEVDLTPEELAHVRQCARCQAVERLFRKYLDTPDEEGRSAVPRPAIFGTLLAAAASIAVAVSLLFVFWPSESVTLDAWMEMVPGEATRSAPTQADGLPVLRSGDRFRIGVRLDRTAHVYLFVYDSKRRVQWIHPTAGTASEGHGYGVHLIPTPPASYTLDENQGIESVIVLAAAHPVADTDGLLADLRAAASREEERSAALKRMQVVLSPFGTVAGTITFRHE